VRRTHSETGKPTLDETRHYPQPGTGSERALGTSGENPRIEDVTGLDEDGEKEQDREREEEQEQAKRDREYEERMEDEYAKREGGA
jgi:hypothetical protein